MSTIIPIADALRVAPLQNRNGVVLTWRAHNKVAVIAQPSGKLLAIHSIRKVTPGTRVTVQGIKWGTPTRGIKWAAPGRGIKWGIKWGRNGTYQSPIRRGKKAVWTPVRGPIVKRFGKKAIAIGTRGGIVVVRTPALRRGSEGLAGQKSLNAAALPPVGATVSVRVFFGPKGNRIGRDLKYLKPPIPGAILPVAGRIVAIDPVAKTMVLVDRQDPAFPVRFVVALPPEFTLAPYEVGEDVAAEGTIAPTGAVTATLIGPNDNFTEADDPTQVQVATGGTSPCAKALNACPTGGNPPPGPGTDPVPPTSPSTPNPPTPPSGGTPPPGPGTGPGVPPPPACALRRQDNRIGAHRPRACIVEWCRDRIEDGARAPKWCRIVIDLHDGRTTPPKPPWRAS